MPNQRAQSNRNSARCVKLYKREKIKKRDTDRDVQRALKSHT